MTSTISRGCKFGLGFFFNNERVEMHGGSQETAHDTGVTIYDEFAVAGAWPGDKWYRHLPVPDLWDPAANVTCPGDGTLALEAKPFTLTRRDGHDNVKALIYSTAEFSAGPHGLLTVETDMRVTTFGTERNPHRVDAGDVRLGCGALNTIDLKSWMVFDFFVSGSRIVPLYERLPFGQRQDNPYPAFTELIPIATPTSPGQWHRYAIRYDRTNDRVAWRVDGVTVAERSAVGAPPGERGPVVKVDSIKIGGGLFTMFGDLYNDRACMDDRARIGGLDPRYERTLFGQGARVEFKAFKIARE
jgi:hypothetical protein